MSFRDSRAYRGGLVVSCIALLGAGGFLGYKAFRKAPPPEARAGEATASYEAGLQALQAKQFADATAGFDRAATVAGECLAEVEQLVRSGEAQKPEYRARLDHLAGELLWVKARAVRDRAFARAAAAGKPILETPDNTFRETFRNFLLIPDEAERKDAVGSLLASARWLETDPDVLKEALRTEVILRPLRWPQVEKYSRATLAVNPKDPRAQLMLAQYEFEQPRSEDNNAPTADAKKDKDRVAKAWDHLTQAKASGSSPYWRTAFLEAQMLRWKANDGATAKAARGGPPRFDTPLRELLFHPETGAVARAARGDEFTTLGTPDVRGLVGLFDLAAEVAVADAAGPDGNSGRAMTLVKGALRAKGEPIQKDARPELAGIVLRSATTVLPVAGSPRSPEWQTVFDQVWEAAAAADFGLDRPAVAALFGRFAVRDVYQALAEGDPTAATTRANRAVGLLEAATATNRPANAPPVGEEVHAALAELKLLRGDRPEAVEPQLAAVRAGKPSRSRTVGQMVEAALAARGGRLTKARQLLEPLTATDQADVAFRANALLAHVALAGGWPATAITPLQKVREGYQKFATLTPEEQGWVAEYFHGQGEATALTAVAHLEVARQRVAAARRTNPTGPVPADLIAPHGRAIDAVLKELPAVGGPNLTARLAQAELLALAGKSDEATKRLDALAASYPNSVDLLRARADQLAPRDAPPSPGDEVIQAFIFAHPESAQAKLYWAEWLGRTGRVHRAITYLNDSMTRVPVALRDELGRVLKAVVAPDTSAFGQAVGKVAPPADLVAAVIRAAAVRTPAEDRSSPPPARYTTEGLARIYGAAAALAAGGTGEAAPQFAAALEFTVCRPAAQAGLVKASLDDAKTDPVKARDLAVRLAGEYPSEPGVYLAVAAAAAAADDVGKPNDSWTRVKNVTSALARWEATARAGGMAKEESAAAAADLSRAVAKPR